MSGRRPRVYVAAPFEDSGTVRHVHDALSDRGCSPTSTWASEAAGAEDFSRFAPDRLREIAERNDRDVLASDAVLVLARAGAGGEMFAAARLAIAAGIPVVWWGRRTLSAWRADVTRVEDLGDAIAHVVALAEVQRDDGYGPATALRELVAQLGWAYEQESLHPENRGLARRTRALAWLIEAFGRVDAGELAEARRFARERLSRRLGTASTVAVAAAPESAPPPTSPASPVALEREANGPALRRALGAIRDVVAASNRAAVVLAALERDIDL